MSFALLASCIITRTRGYALYPNTYPPPKPEEVATLSGYVQRVDGESVPKEASSFELLPGCHLVVTPTEWGRFGGGTGAFIVKTGHRLFALPMKAAHQYAVGLRTSDQMTGPTASMMIEAIETDRKGAVIKAWTPARSRSDVDACREEAIQSAQTIAAKQPSEFSADSAASDTGSAIDAGASDATADL